MLMGRNPLALPSGALGITMQSPFCPAPAVLSQTTLSAPSSFSTMAPESLALGAATLLPLPGTTISRSFYQRARSFSNLVLGGLLVLMAATSTMLPPAHAAENTMPSAAVNGTATSEDATNSDTAPTAATAATTATSADNELYIFNWSDYIDPEVLTDFTKETGIKVHYDLMYSNEVLEAKLMVGNSGYDIVAPSIHVLKRLGDAGMLLPLDKKLLPNWSHLDKDKMAKIATIDKDNTYGIPYMELSTGIAYNTQKIQEIMGTDYKIDSWDVFFQEDQIKKFESCGVTALDSASDMLCSTLIYLGLNPESKNKKDYDAAAEILKTMGKHVRYFHSAQYSNDLAAGEVCLSVAWAGDAQLANQRSQEAGMSSITYVLPKEGALMGYDMLAIPNDAKHVANAHKFLDYIMRPEVIAKISNYIRFANANADATPLVDKDITSNPGIYYDKETLKRLHIVVPPASVERLMTREWNSVISASGTH